MHRIRILAAVALATTCAVALTNTAWAGPVPSSFSAVPGTPFDTLALTEFATDGTLMGGSEVTVNFGGGLSQTAIWSNTTSSAAGTGWSLSVLGDTFDIPWVLANTTADTIVGFAFDGLLGDTTFDIVSNATLSPGSFFGRPFSNAVASNETEITGADAIYSNELSVGGVFYGDLYVRMDVAFRGDGLTSNNTFSFIADTDNADVSSGGIVPTPEPASLALLGVALAGLGALRRRRRG